jgi:putative exosortase-associated protein (TIGR04073 family)
MARTTARLFRRAGAGFALGALLALPQVAGAQEYSAARKLGRGLAGTVTGFLEVPGNMTRVYQERGPAMGFTLGFAQGLGKLVVREIVGAYEILTSWFEVPPGFKPILEPEFPWGYFGESRPGRR